MFIMIPMRNMQQNYLIFSHSSFRMPDSPQQDETQQRLLKVEQDILGANNQLADMNRRFFANQHILALNLVSSPGSGKTTLLTTTLNALKMTILAM